MASVIVSDTDLINIANAIRAKNGLTTKYKPSEMAQAILALPTKSIGVTPTGLLTVNSDGVYNVTDYANVKVEGVSPKEILNIVNPGTYDVTKYGTV